MFCARGVRNIAISISIGVLGTVSGCSAPPTILSPYETDLGVQDGVSREFHSSLYYPKGLALQYPGYVVGIQKANQTTVRGLLIMGFPDFLVEKPKYFDEGEKETKWGLGSLDLLKQLKSDRKAMFVSHVTRFSFKHEALPAENVTMRRPYTYIDSCFIYNAFQSPYFHRNRTTNVSASTKRRWNDLGGVIAWKNCPNAVPWQKSAAEVDLQDFYSNGKPALQALAESVVSDLKTDGYTHVLILVMGWNTAQDEAIRNFNDVTGNLIEAARESEKAKTHLTGSNHLPFRPLVIGISWPSYWSRGLTNVFSYPNKAKDADELGITWLNLFVNRQLPDAIDDAKIKVPIVLIGHSFGARVLSRTAAAYPALNSSSGKVRKEPFSGANLVIGLQGAVSINRFWPGGKEKPPGDEGAPLRDLSKFESTTFAFTASKHDSAVGGPVFWFDPSGSIKSYDLACGKSRGWWQTVFHCFRAHDVSGLTSPVDKIQPWNGFKICEKDKDSNCRFVSERLAKDKGDKRVIYIDASDGITEFNTLGTGGDAHSDIYRLPMGRLLWMLISSLAPHE